MICIQCSFLYFIYGGKYQHCHLISLSPHAHMLTSTTQHTSIKSYFAATTAHWKVQVETLTTYAYKLKAYPVLCAWTALTDCITMQSQLSCRNLAFNTVWDVFGWSAAKPTYCRFCRSWEDYRTNNFPMMELLLHSAVEILQKKQQLIGHTWDSECTGASY